MSSFSVLVVCTGNVARSPMAQRLLQARLGDSPDISVSSAGTWGLQGSPMERHAATVLAEAGVEEGGFRARRLTAPMVRNADLVLTATRQHRVDVLSHDPAVLRRTFTLREMAQLLATLDGLGAAAAQPHVRALVESVASARGTIRIRAVDHDVPDPYGADISTYRRCRDQIRSATDVVADAILACGQV